MKIVNSNSCLRVIHMNIDIKPNTEKGLRTFSLMMINFMENTEKLCSKIENSSKYQQLTTGTKNMIQDAHQLKICAKANIQIINAIMNGVADYGMDIPVILTPYSGDIDPLKVVGSINSMN